MVRTSSPEVITGRVARLITGNELVINRGSRDGVTKGMVFDVLDTSTEHITDPETGEDLGSIRRVKAGLYVITVAERVCLTRRRRSSAKSVSALFDLTDSSSDWSEYGVELGDPVESVPGPVTS